MSGKGSRPRPIQDLDRFEMNFEMIFGKKQKKTYSEDWQSPDRDKAIAQNGNTGEHYDLIENNKSTV